MKQLMSVAAVMMATAAIAHAQAPAPAAAARPAQPVVTATATAPIADPMGQAVGRATLQQVPAGVLLRVELTNAPAGVHGLHIHDVGRCEGPAFQSAGGHFNPTMHQHGFMNADGSHAGDLPNVDVPASKQATVEYLLAGATLTGGANPLLDANGAAIVLHATRDNYASDPAGDSGARIACGVLARGDQPQR